MRSALAALVGRTNIALLLSCLQLVESPAAKVSLLLRAVVFGEAGTTLPERHCPEVGWSV
jgi:hypothetical protein